MNSFLFFFSNNESSTIRRLSINYCVWINYLQVLPPVFTFKSTSTLLELRCTHLKSICYFYLKKNMNFSLLKINWSIYQLCRPAVRAFDHVQVLCQHSFSWYQQPRQLEPEFVESVYSVCYQRHLGHHQLLDHSYQPYLISRKLKFKKKILFEFNATTHILLILFGDWN